MRFPLSVKQKILLSLWGISFFTLFLAGTLAVFWFAKDQSNRLDDFLSRETRGVQDIMSTYFNVNSGEDSAHDSFANPDFQTFVDNYFQERLNRPLPYKTTLGLIDRSGKIVKATNEALSLGAPNLPLSQDIQLVTIPGPPETRMAMIALIHNDRVLGTIRLACLTVTLSEGLNSFLFSLTTILILVFLCFGFLATAMIHWSLHPVRQMSTSAQQISDSHLDLRLTVPPGKDEISEMALTLNRLLERLEKDFEFEEALVGQLSHELRTPLTILRGRNEVALERRPTEDIRSLLEDNLADIDNVVSLLNTLLNLARMDGRMDLVERRPCDLAAVLEDLIEELEPLWDEKDLSFHLALPDHSTSWAQCPALHTKGDPTLLRQAFLNILTNAFKYTPRSSRIHLTISESGDADNPTWSVVIRNHGPSIPEESLNLIFKRFYRVESQDPDHYERSAGLGQKGFGLGLSISKTMVELHKGQIRAFTPTNGGAAFEVILPRVKTIFERKKQRSPE